MMKNMHFRRSRVAAAVAGAVLALGASQAFATAFQLNEQSASSLGNAFAGGATFTDDASGMWWNPAALSWFTKPQAVAAVHIVTPMIEFSNNGSLAATNQPLGHDGGDAGTVNVIPNMYIAVPINPQWTFGLGITAPFGLVTHYGDGWIGRYQALKSEIQTINVNPAISWKATPQLALAAGVNYQHIKATLNNNVNYSGALLQAATLAAGAGQIPASLIPQIAAATPGLDSLATVKGDDDAWGWNVGVMWDATPALRLGASYRSEIKYKVEGTADFNNPAATAPGALGPVVANLSNAINATRLFNSGVSADIKLPQIANISAHWQYNPQWEFMADLQYTGWSSIKELRFVRSNGVELANTPENFDDTWKIAVGASYQYNNQWKARIGVAYDQSPVNDTDRTPRLPDSDRIWLSLGGQYKFAPNLWLDAGFTYIWGKSASINQNAGSTAGSGLLKGDYDAGVTILSGQLTYQF